MIARPLEGLDRLVARATARQDALRARGAYLRERVQVAADQLAAQFRVERVVLFGSLARGTFHERSDVDMAVWGLAPADESAAVDLAARTLEAPVDLVRMEVASARLAARVADEGNELVSRR